MTMDEQTPDLARQIGFAEAWLARARRQVGDGHHARGALTLLLAEAEVQRARERVLATAVEGRPQRSRASGAGVIAAAIGICLGAAFLGWWATRQVDPVASALTPAPIVVLDAATGTMLGMVRPPEAPVERTVIKAVVLRIPAPPALVAPPAASPVPVQAAVPAQALQPPAPPSPPVVVAAAEPVPAPPVLLSEADLIELVLAAERSLRRSGGQ
jgi:hypothetical protein